MPELIDLRHAGAHLSDHRGRPHRPPGERRPTPWRRMPLLHLIASLTAAASVDAARGADHCVTCTGPDSSYACTVTGLSDAAASGLQGRLLCIQHLATTGGHGSCSVATTATGVCTGVPRTVSPPQSAATPAAPDGIGAAPPVAAASAPPAAQVKVTGPPADPAGGAGSSPLDKVGRGIAEAGKSVGNAAGKTWSCVVSLFKDC